MFRVADLTEKQQAELRRLVNEGVPEDQARAIVTEIRLDAVIDGSGASDPRIPRLLSE